MIRIATRNAHLKDISINFSQMKLWIHLSLVTTTSPCFYAQAFTAYTLFCTSFMMYELHAFLWVVCLREKWERERERERERGRESVYSKGICRKRNWREEKAKQCLTWNVALAYFPYSYFPDLDFARETLNY